MVSLVAVLSMYLAAPMTIGMLVTPEWRSRRRRLARTRLNLWILIVVVAILAIDFAIVVQSVRRPERGIILCVSDAAVIVVPLVATMLAERTLWGVWWMAILVGWLGLLGYTSL